MHPLTDRELLHASSFAADFACAFAFHDVLLLRPLLSEHFVGSAERKEAEEDEEH